MNLEYKKIKDFAVIHSGTTPSTSKPEFWNGEIKWITPAELKDGHNWYVFDTERKLTDIAVTGKRLKMLKRGTVLLTSRAPIGKVALVGEPMCTNQGFKNIECDTNIMNPEFLYFWLLGKKEYLNSLGRGATFKEVSKTIVEDILVPVPSLETQNKIIHILSRALSLIDKRKAQIELLSSLNQSVFLEMFGDPNTNNKNWDVYKISDVCDVYNGSTPKSNVSEYWNGEIFWATPTDLESVGNYFLYDTERKITKFGLEKTNLKLLPKGTVLLTSRAPIGKVAISGVELCTNQGFKSFVCNDQKINNVYLYQFLVFHNQTLNNLGRGATFKEISKSIISNFKMPLPPIDLQIEYSRIIKEIENQKAVLNNSLEQLEYNFQTLTNIAFNGELYNK